jgi:non-specific serine/threonine protein kinase
LAENSDRDMPEQDGRPIHRHEGWEINLDRRDLRSRGVLVPLGSRAFEIVEILVRAAGDLVGKYELMERVWPGAIVEDNTLQFHISAIRKALGADRDLLRTVSGRGYRLLGSWAVRQGTSRRAPAETEPDEPVHTNIPLAASDLIGRAAAHQLLSDAVSAYRVITLTGPGGIGKSVLALDVARSLIEAFAGDCWLVELVALSDAALLPSTVATALDLRMGVRGNSGEAVARAIGPRKLLLLLDNCEHIIDAAASFVETVIRLCPAASVLVTSRETLRIEGEYVFRVPPLEVPPQHALVADQALEYSATQLFISRIKALTQDLRVDSETVRTVAAICRRLDGIPLAIEFAAASAATLGVNEVAARLDDRFALLTNGRRTSLSRHRTLRAVLDWSFELLPEFERRLLRHVAVFPAGFTLRAAAAIVNDPDGVGSRIAMAISNLVSKSLVVLDDKGPEARWRLLETIRVYALEKLMESAEADAAARRRAEYFYTLSGSPASGSKLQEVLDKIAFYIPDADNVRAALAWAFGDTGDAALGCALTACAMDYWFAASLLNDCCEWGSKAIARIDDAAGTRQEMVLQSGLGLARLFTGTVHTDTRDALIRARALAQAHGDLEYQQRALYGLWLFSARTLQFRAQLGFAQLYEQTVRDASDPAAQPTADWLIGSAQSALEEYREAFASLQRAIDRYPAAARPRDIVRFGIDPPSRARSYLAGHLLMRGAIDTGIRLSESAIHMARAINHPASLCNCLAFPAATLFLKLSEVSQTMRHVSELIDRGQRHGLDLERLIGVCAQGVLAARLGDTGLAIEFLRAGLDEMREKGYKVYVPFFQGELAEVLASVGRVEEGLLEIEASLQVPADTSYLWFDPESIRIKAQILSLRGFANDAAAEHLFRQSIEQARERQTLYWELRSATSLAEFWVARSRVREAREMLSPIYSRFTEGFATADLQRAKHILEQGNA